MDKRLFYRVIIKSLFLVVLVVLTAVLINSLFAPNNDKASKDKNVSLLEIDVSRLKQGELRKILWKGKNLILFKNKNKYFMFYNTGDSGNCPLFKEANAFKDICTGTRFNFSGELIGNEKQGLKLLSPPYYVEGNIIFLGVSEN